MKNVVYIDSSVPDANIVIYVKRDNDIFREEVKEGTMHIQSEECGKDSMKVYLLTLLPYLDSWLRLRM